MGSHELDESYFSCSTPAFGERARPRLGREDSVGDALFTLSGCNTPTLETVPAVVDYVCESSPKAHRHGVGGGKLRADKSKSGMCVRTWFVDPELRVSEGLTLSSRVLCSKVS